jgi:hypothetical protein
MSFSCSDFALSFCAGVLSPLLREPLLSASSLGNMIVLVLSSVSTSFRFLLHFQNLENCIYLSTLM